VYTPIARAISITDSGFNQTKVSGFHGVTPFTWINFQDSPQQLVIQNVVRLTLSPGQNYTHVFDSPGTYYYSVPASSFNGTATIG
jgi:plastocyanin